MDLNTFVKAQIIELTSELKTIQQNIQTLNTLFEIKSRQLEELKQSLK